MNTSVDSWYISTFSSVKQSFNSLQDLHWIYCQSTLVTWQQQNLWFRWHCRKRHLSQDWKSLSIEKCKFIHFIYLQVFRANPSMMSKWPVFMIFLSQLFPVMSCTGAKLTGHRRHRLATHAASKLIDGMLSGTVSCHLCSYAVCLSDRWLVKHRMIQPGAPQDSFAKCQTYDSRLQR